MMIQKPNLIISFILVLLINSCGKEDFEDQSCFIYKNELVNFVDGPSQINTGDIAYIMVKYLCPERCALTTNFETIDSIGNNYYVQVISKTDACSGCLTIGWNEVAYYVFEPTSKGTYSFNFMAKTDSVISHTIVVN